MFSEKAVNEYHAETHHKKQASKLGQMPCPYLTAVHVYFTASKIRFTYE